MNTIYKGIVYLESDNQFEQLMKEGSVTLASGEVVTYSPNDTTYYTPSSAIDKEYVDDNFIKKTDYATQENAGVVKVSSGNYGVALDSNNTLYNVKALNAEIDVKTQDYKSITPTNLNYAVKSSLIADNGISLTSDELTKVKSKFEIPSEYLKDASVTDNTLTITKQDDTQVNFQGGGDISNKVDSKLSKEFTKEDNTKYTNYSQVINTLEPTSSESKGISLIYTNNVNPDSENNIGSSSILQMTDSDDETSLAIVNSKILNDGNGKVSQILSDPTTINMYITNTDSTVDYQSISFGLSSDGIISELINDDKTNSISQYKDGINFHFTNNNKTSALILNENEINIDTSTLTPNTDNSVGLGKTTTRYKDLYLAGKLSDGTNETTINELTNNISSIISKVDGSYSSTTDNIYTNIYNGKYEITDSEGNISNKYGSAITYSSDKPYNPITDEEVSASNYGGLYCDMYKTEDYTGAIKTYHHVGMIEGSNENSVQKITGLNLSTIDNPQIQMGLTKLVTTSTGDVDTDNSIATQVQINSNGMNFADMLGRDNLSITSEGITAKHGADGITYDLKYSNIATKSDIPSTTIVQRNYLYNQQFNINQRSKTSYPVGTAKSYCLDRWQKDPDVVVTYASRQDIATVSNMSTTTMEGICQFIFDHSNLLGKQVTFCLKTTTGTYTLTSDTLPTDPETTSQNTILKTVSTDFGALQLEFATKHFCIKILLNPATSETEYTTITPKSAKLEEGTVYTGLTLNTRVIDSDECRHFYQKLSCRSAYATGFIEYFPAKTAYNLIFPLNTNLYMTSLTFVKDSESNNPKIYKLNGETLTLTDYRTFTAKYKDADRTFLHMYIDYEVDNSEMLGDKTKMMEMCFGQLPGFAVDAEITS